LKNVKGATRLALYCAVTVTCEEAVPKTTLSVTVDPCVGIVGDVPSVSPVSLRVKLVCAPGASASDAPPKEKERGWLIPPASAQPNGADMIVQVVTGQEGAVPAPVFVPANRMTHDVAVRQEIVLPPLFLIVMEMALGAVVDDVATMDAPITAMLALDVALFTKLYTEALTTPPTPRTAATMINRSMLCEMALLCRLIFIDAEVGCLL
jgi:hypothetical protein